MNLSEKIKAKIKWLQTQPENVKVRYVWVSAFVVFAVVALLWAGLFRKYERRAIDNGKKAEFIKEGERIKEDIGNKIKAPDLDVPLKQMLSNSPAASPGISVSPKASVSPEPLPESLK